MKNYISLLLIIIFSFSTLSCATDNHGNIVITRQAGTAALCGGGGAFAGAVIDKKDPLRGLLIGGFLGVVVCSEITKQADRAAKEAALRNRRISRRFEGGRVEAEPIRRYERNSPAHDGDVKEECCEVKITSYQGGKAVGTETREICD